MWIEKESPLLAWYRTHTENEKETHLEFFNELHKHIVPYT